MDESDFGRYGDRILGGGLPEEAPRRGRKRALAALVVMLILAASAVGWVQLKTSNLETNPLSARDNGPIEVAVPVTTTNSAGETTTSTPTPTAADTDRVRPVSSGEENILVIGTDTREGQTSETRGDSYGEGLADVLLLVHVPADRSGATVVSIPRDTMVKVPRCRDRETGRTWEAEEFVQVNHTIRRGGPGCTVATVEVLSGMRMTHYALVNFDAVVALTEEVGGATVTLDKPLNDDVLDFHLDAGEHDLKGIDALNFLRSRHGVGGGDLNRIRDQHMFLGALASKLQNAGTLLNPVKLNSLVDVMVNNVEFDDTLSSATSIAGLIASLATVPADRIEFTHLPVQEWSQDRNRLEVIESEAADLWAGLTSPGRS